MMSETPVASPPRWYLPVAILTLVWTAMGVAAWVGDLRMTEAALAAMPPEQQQLFATRPPWVFVAYGVAVFSGLGGAIGLLLRRRWAVTAFAISLAAVTVQFAWVFLVMNAIAAIGAAAAVPLPATVITLQVAMLWFARRAERRGWISQGATGTPRIRSATMG
jgi:hypothetical protein